MSVTTVIAGIELDLDVTVEGAAHQIREIIAEIGDRVYEAPEFECVYADADAPSCLVGHWLHRQGVPVDGLGLSLAGIDKLRYDKPGGLVAGALASFAADEVLQWLGYDDELARFMATLQERQDRGTLPWSQCLEVALDETLHPEA